MHEHAQVVKVRSNHYGARACIQGDGGRQRRVKPIEVVGDSVGGGRNLALGCAGGRESEW